MTENIKKLIILLCISIILYLIYKLYNHFYKNKIDNHIEETFEDFKKGKETAPVCVKPFSITNETDKVYDAIKILNQKIDEMEYSMKKGDKKYGEMYDWYKQKTDKTSQEAQKAQAKTQAELKKNMDNALKSAENDFKGKNEAVFNKEALTNAPPEGQTVKDLLSAATKTGDGDEKKEVSNATADLDLPSGFL